MKNETSNLVSIHGGHSGEFCGHAQDSLEGIVKAYIEKGFNWIGVTEHIPPPCERFLASEEKEQGLSLSDVTERFNRYFVKARELKKKFEPVITIFVGFETETYEDYERHVASLRNEFQPDYIVGSLHSIKDLDFDIDPNSYAYVAEVHGGIDSMYCAYFDEQFELIKKVKPEVVGHFDLIRIYDKDYRERFFKKEIWIRLIRNLQLIKDLDLILDYNVSSLRKGAQEPYVSEPILNKAIELGIDIVPGDDSHGVTSVGVFVEKGIKILEKHGVVPKWRRPDSKLS